MPDMNRHISMVVAMDQNRLIGRHGQLPWRLPEDLRHFRRLTLGKTVLMGRKTFESLGKPLEQRQNWVLSRDARFRPEGCRVFETLDAAVAAHPEGELMVIGGAEIYRQALPLADRIHLTLVHAALEGDTWFPELPPGRFRETQRHDHPADARHAHPYSFVTLDRA